MRIKDFAKQVQHARKNGTYAMLNQASFQEHAEGYKFHNIAPPHKRDTCPYCIVSHSCQYQKDFSPHCSKPSKHEPSECSPESWEARFDGDIGLAYTKRTPDGRFYEHPLYDYIKAFIRSLLAKQREEIIHKAEYKGYGEAIQDIKALGLKHCEKSWKKLLKT